jgi:squalene synthase HpnC
MAVDHYENFPVASMLLPRRLRAAILAIYRFARAADDIVDEGDASKEQRLADLANFEERLDAVAAGQPPDAPVFRALASAVERHALPIQAFRDLLSAFRQDVTVGRYPRYPDLLDYCRRSANPIGRLVLQVYGVAGRENYTYSDAICTALQLVNCWQDVASDWRRGRIYIPQEDLARFGVDELDIANARCTSAWRELMTFEVERTRALLESGRPLTAALPWRLALELRGVLAGGLHILDGIAKARGDVFRHRPRIAGVQWALVTARALF